MFQWASDLLIDQPGKNGLVKKWRPKKWRIRISHYMEEHMKNLVPNVLVLIVVTFTFHAFQRLESNRSN